MKAIIFIQIFTAVCLLGCNQPTSSDYTTPTETKKTSDGISYTLTIPKVVFAVTDSLQLTFRVQNESNAVKEFVFANQQQFDFQLTGSTGHVALFYPLIVQPAGSGFVLRPGESKVFSISWMFKDHNANFVNRGDYRLTASLAEGNSPAVNLQISVQ